MYTTTFVAKSLMSANKVQNCYFQARAKNKFSCNQNLNWAR